VAWSLKATRPLAFLCQGSLINPCAVLSSDMGASWTILLTLLIILGASLAMFSQLVRRHTTRRGRFVKWEWAVNRGFRQRAPAPVTMDALDEIRDQALRTLEHYQSRDGSTQIMRLQTVSPEGQVRQWHACIRTVDTYSTPIALRPTAVPVSLVDLMRLHHFPKLSNETRFAVYGLQAIEARKLATGPTRALLPPDIGLIRNADAVILDFTARPFDTTEFSRLCAVAEQIAGSLAK